MRKVFSYNRVFVAVFLLGIILYSCRKSDYYYKDYIIKRTYPGKVDSVWAKPGNERVKLYWLNSKDLGTKNLVVYWNNAQDSLLTAIDHQRDTGSFIIDGLQEGDYTFSVVTTDEKGNHSLPVEISTTIYGSTFQDRLLFNGEIDHVVSMKDSVFLLWNTLSLDKFLGNTVEYTNTGDKKHTIFVPPGDMATTIRDIDTTAPITIRSLYKPDSLALDTFYTASREVNLTDATKIHAFHLPNDGTGANAEFMDFNYVNLYKMDEIPAPAAIDLYHIRGAGSKHNFATVTSGRMSSWSSDMSTQIDGWDVRHAGELIPIGSGSDAQAVYDNLDEYNRTNFIHVYDSVSAANSGDDFITHVETGDIILFHDDRGIYVAIKATYAENDGIIDIAFKVSRP